MASVTTLARDDKSSLLAREAKQHRSVLKALLDKPNAPPGSPDIDYARKEVRNAYLKLLFACTFSSRAHGADTALWLETTHPLVHKYRSKLSVYEKEFSKAKVADQAAGGAGGGARTSKQHQGQQTQAYLKLSVAFRDFLSTEETFWRDLAGRVVRVFRLDEAKANLRVLGIACDDHDASLSFSSDTSTGMERIPGADGADEALLQAARLPANRKRLVEVVHKALICCGDLARYRELYRDDRAVEGATGSAAAAGKRGSSRPRGGKAIVAAVAARTSKEVSLRRNFSKAAACYEQARLLLPHNGNPSNQLAVIATYYRDSFLATYHYYRALCVRVPFETAKQNLEITLRKAVDAWVAQGGPERLRAGTVSERATVQGSVQESAAQSEECAAKTLSSFVTLHGLLYTRQHFTLIQSYSEEFLCALQTSLSERALLADAVVRIVVTGLAASWTTRLWRNGPGAPSASASRSRRGRTSDDASADAAPSMAATRSAEHQILSHVLGVFRTLVEVGTLETREALETNRKHPPTAPARMRGVADASANAARNITAAFRRTLPALRISSKWMKSHLEYISRSADRAAALTQESQDSSQPSGPAELSQREQEEAEARIKAESALVVETAALWRSYVDFVNILRFAFPFDALPSLGTMGESGAIALALEEDADMRGFAPTSKAMLYVNGTSPEAPTQQPSTSQVHPNEEQLMRIADLLIDAKVMAESDASPIAFDDERNVFVFDEGGPGVGVTQRNIAPIIPLAPAVLAPDQYIARGHVEEGSENTSEATEDVVDLAMRAGAGGLNEDDDDEDDDDEQILIPSSARAHGAQSLLRQQEQQLREHRQQQGAADPFASPGTPMSRRAVPTTSPAPDIEPGSLTAQHLLLQVLSGRSPAPGASPTPFGSGSPPASARPHVASVPQPQLLFGGVAEMSIAGTASIWAPGPGEAGRPFSPSRAAWDSAGSSAPGSGAAGSGAPRLPHGHIGAPFGGTAHMQTQSTMAGSMGSSNPFGVSQSFVPGPDAFAQAQYHQHQQQQHEYQQQQHSSYGTQPARDTTALQRQHLQQPYFGG